MSYESDIQVLEGLVRIEVSGERIPGDVALDSGEVMEKTMQVIEKTGITNCLVILNLTGPLSPMDSFDIVSISEEVGWQRNFRVAMVDRNTASIQDTQFTEVVAGNRAFPVRVFDNEDDARDWLLSIPHNA
jgi:hypothetical protein